MNNNTRYFNNSTTGMTIALVLMAVTIAASFIDSALPCDPSECYEASQEEIEAGQCEGPYGELTKMDNVEVCIAV